MVQHATLADEGDREEPSRTATRGSDPELPERFAFGTREQVVVGSALGARPRELDAIDDAAFAVARDGRIRDVNRAAERLVGAADAALIGALFDRVVTWPADLPPPAFDAPELGIQPFDASARIALVRTDGAVLPVEVLVCPHRAGTSLAIVRQTVPLPAQVAVDDLAAIVHDLKNPLATIALESYMLELRFEQAIDDAMVRAFARIRHNLDFADRLVHDLLDLASSNAGSLELVRRPTELAALLEDVVERSVPSRDRTRVFLEAPRAVVASIDDVRIQRVVANLVQNALKYSPATAGVIVRLETPPGAVRISVTDAGPGIPVHEQRALFDRFRRASTGAGIEGTGLGLYVSRQIVEAHGGVIGVENLRGAGARFYFELPV